MKYANCKIGVASVRDRLGRMARDLEDTIKVAKAEEACYIDTMRYLVDAMRTALEETASNG